MQPFDLEMEVHVGRRFAQSVLLVLLQRVLHVHREQGPHGGRRQLTDVQFLGELVEDGCVAVFILLDHRNDQRDQFMPEIQRFQTRAVILGVPLRLVRINLEFPVVDVVAILEEELVGRSKTRLHAILDHGARPRRAGQFQNFHTEECDTREKVDRALQVHQFLLARGGEVISIHREIDSQGVVQLIQ